MVDISAAQGTQMIKSQPDTKMEMPIVTRSGLACLGERKVVKQQEVRLNVG